MGRIIAAQIDLAKVDKSRITEGKNGQKYYDIVVIVNDEPNDYGKDVSIKQGQTKEEREKKAKGIYIGNGKTIWTNEKKAVEAEDNDPSADRDTDDLPF